ncbi:MAG: hypothetical protein ABSH28_12235, partial [Acidobacteriota bacterium]
MMKAGGSSSGQGGTQNAPEGRIRDLLAQGRWRKARDEIKPLCKTNRDRYLPLLIEANVGLAREMLEKRLTSEARQVVAYLKTIAPRETWQTLEAEIALKFADSSAVLAACFPSSGDGSGTISESQRQRALDRVV